MSYKIIRSPEAEELNNTWRVLGKPLPRADAYAKAAGTAKFGDDVLFQDVLYAKILHCPYAHAKIKSIDTSKAKALPGVKAVVSYEDIVNLGLNESMKMAKSYLAVPECIIFNVAYYVGDVVAAVAAEDEAIADEALDLIEVEYEELPFYIAPEDALQSGAYAMHPTVNPNGNLQFPLKYVKGDVTQGFTESDVIIETEIREPAIRHMFLEQFCATAKWEGDALLIWTSVQTPDRVRSALAEGFKMPRNKIEMVLHYPGGGFGGKMPLRACVIAALLAKMTAPRPVKIRTNVREQFVLQHKLEAGPGTWKLKIGATADGTIKSMDETVIAGMGAHQMGFPVGLGASGPCLFMLLYRGENKQYTASSVWTNTLTGGALRAYGSQSAAFAVDIAISELEEKLGMDPVEFIGKNGARTGDWAAFEGYTIAGGDLPGLAAKGAEEFGWNEKWKGWGVPTAVNGAKRRGVGVGVATHFSGEQSPISDEVIVKLLGDCTAEVHVAVTDMGSGLETAMCQAVAEVLALDLKDVRKVPAKADQPHAMGTAASRGLPTTTTAAYHAAQDVKQKLLERAAPLLGVTPEELDVKDKAVYVIADPTKKLTYEQLLGGLYAGSQTGIGYGLAYLGPHATINPETGQPFVERGLFCAFAEVEVDTDTGELEIIKVQISPETGMVVNPDILYGQIMGGITHGCSQMLGEGWFFDEATGTVVNSSLIYYPQLTSLDVREEQFSIVVVSDPAHAPLIPFHAKGVAEGIYCAVWPAINMAIYNAIGTRIREFPFRPEKILKALGKAQFPVTKGVA